MPALMTATGSFAAGTATCSAPPASLNSPLLVHAATMFWTVAGSADGGSAGSAKVLGLAQPASKRIAVSADALRAAFS